MNELTRVAAVVAVAAAAAAAVVAADPLSRQKFRPARWTSCVVLSSWIKF